MKPNSPHPMATRESGWLPDYVYAGEKLEAGLAFFADPLGRITRFSREPDDLAGARKLSGQVALPGLVNGHSQTWHRILRGRLGSGALSANEATGTARETVNRAITALSDEDVYDTARMAFMEMLLSGVTCVGEFHTLHHRPDGSPWPDANHLSLDVLRAARDTGIRIALFKVACSQVETASGGTRSVTANAEDFLRDMDVLRETVAREFPGDESWLSVGVDGWLQAPLDYVKTVAAYARAKRFRLHVPVSACQADNDASIAAFGRTPVGVLAEHGLIDKRFTAIHANHLTQEDVRLLGAARATVCACPSSDVCRASGATPARDLLAAEASVSIGTGSQAQINLLEEACRLDRPFSGATAAASLFHAATVVGARSVGAPSGALEVGRPADFFTVNLYDPSIAGVEPESLLETIVYSLERRAIREVWMGGRQRLTNGRHPQHGPIVGRFVDLQRRLWGRSS